MVYVWRLMIVVAVGLLGVAVIVGSIPHGICGSYLFTVHPNDVQMTGLVAEVWGSDPWSLPCYAQVNADGIPFWTVVFFAILVGVAALVIRATSRSRQKRLR